MHMRQMEGAHVDSFVPVDNVLFSLFHRGRAYPAETSETEGVSLDSSLGSSVFTMFVLWDMFHYGRALSVICAL